MKVPREIIAVWIFVLILIGIVLIAVFFAPPTARGQAVWRSETVVIFPDNYQPYHRHYNQYPSYRYYSYSRYHYYPRYNYYPNPYYYFPTPNTWPRFYVGPRGLVIY